MVGAGAVVRQDLTRIDQAVADGSLARNEVLLEAFAGAERVHLLGLVSDGGVHSGFEHLRALIEQLYNGPYLELFGRRNVPKWTVIGHPLGTAA